MGQEESPLTFTEIASSSEYEFENKASIGFFLLSLYIFLLPTLLPLSLLPINSPFFTTIITTTTLL